MGAIGMDGPFYILLPCLSHDPGGWAQPYFQCLSIHERESVTSLDKPIAEPGHLDILGERIRAAVMYRHGRESPVLWGGPEHKYQTCSAP